MAPPAKPKCEKCKGTGWISYTGRRGNKTRMVCQDCHPAKKK